MKKGMNLLVTIFVMTILFGCSKSDVAEENANCYVCSTEAESIDVCQEDGSFVIDGEMVTNENGASLEDLVRAIEANPDNDPALEGISCRRK